MAQEELTVTARALRRDLKSLKKKAVKARDAAEKLAQMCKSGSGYRARAALTACCKWQEALQELDIPGLQNALDANRYSPVSDGTRNSTTLPLAKLVNGIDTKSLEVAAFQFIRSTQRQGLSFGRRADAAIRTAFDLLYCLCSIDTLPDCIDRVEDAALDLVQLMGSYLDGDTVDWDGLPYLRIGLMMRALDTHTHTFGVQQILWETSTKYLSEYCCDGSTAAAAYRLIDDIRDGKHPFKLGSVVNTIEIAQAAVEQADVLLKVLVSSVPKAANDGKS